TCTRGSSCASASAFSFEGAPMQWQSFAPLTVAAAVITVPAQAKVYLTPEQAQQVLFPGATLSAMPVHITPEQKGAVERQSGVTIRALEQQVWRASDGGYFIIDSVIGKHEYITYAVALDAQGAVLGIEIMEYRESYGSEIRDADWRRQFLGKTS